MTYKPHWDRQFAESEWETAARWKATKEKRKAEGKCWQCEKLIAECKCSNIDHAKARK